MRLPFPSSFLTMPSSPKNSVESSAISSRIRQFFVDHFNYFTIHALYFVVVTFIGGGVLYACEKVKEDEPAFIDCLFIAVSAMCVTGLVSIDFSHYEQSSQAVVFILMILGGQVFMSVVPVIVRQQYFDQAIEEQTASLEIEVKEQAKHMPEYEALRLVAKICICIFFTAIVLSTLLLGLYFQFVPSRKAIMDRNNVNPWWFALFTAVASFNNAGFLQLPDNLIQLNDDYFTLGIIMILILIGNTAYPILFRFVAYVLHRRQPNNLARQYLLDHPRRVYTLMFPTLHTRILIMCIIGFTLAEFICFLSLDFNKEYFLQFPPTTRALIGIFQSISTRSAGFNAIDMSQVAPAMSFLICILMYVSAMPIIAGLRNATTQTKQEGDLQLQEELQGEELGECADIEGRKQVSSYGVSGQVADVLQKNGFTLLVCLFILCVSEADDLVLVLPANQVSDKARFGIFALIYEVSSAYGNVGLTLGVPGTLPALSGGFSVVGKLVIIFLMLAGRHRGLPSSVDSAVSLENILAKNRGGRNSLSEARPELPCETIRAQRRFKITESFDRILGGTWGVTNSQSEAPRLCPNTFMDPEAINLVLPNTGRLRSKGSAAGVGASPRPGPITIHTSPPSMTLERMATELKLRNAKDSPESESDESSSNLEGIPKEASSSVETGSKFYSIGSSASMIPADNLKSDEPSSSSSKANPIFFSLQSSVSALPSTTMSNPSAFPSSLSNRT